MKKPLLLTSVFVSLGGVMFLCGWFLDSGDRERLKEDWTRDYRERPHPGKGPLVLGPDGYYWGGTMDSEAMPGYLYKMQPDGSDWQIVHTFRAEGSPPTGIGPSGTVVFDGVDSMLGSTVGDTRSIGRDTLYKVNVKTGVLTTLVKGPYFGNWPRARLVSDGRGNFWGTTVLGGKNQTGTIFKFHLATGVLTTVVEMPESPNSPIDLVDALTSDGKDWWWGTTRRGGKENCGTIIKVKEDTGELVTVAGFTKDHGGCIPDGSLVSDGRGFLWGVCSGGRRGNATVYKVDATTGALTTVVEFTGNWVSNLEASPGAALVDDGQGFLWGCTQSGVSSEGGTVFKVDIASGALTTVVEFDEKQSRHKGWSPYATLVNDGHGAFLGTTQEGGAKNAGTVFKVDVKTGVLTTLVEFGKVGP